MAIEEKYVELYGTGAMWNPPLKPSDLRSQWYGIIAVLVSAAGIWANWILFKAIISNKKMRQEVGTSLIGLLACTDIAMSVAGVVFFGTTTLNDGFPGKWFCHLQGTTYPFLAMTTFFVLAIITYDRYTLLIHNSPLHRPEAFKLSFLMSLIFLVWASLPWLTNNEIGFDEIKKTGLACFVTGGSGHFKHDMVIITNNMVFFVILMAMVYMYWRILAHLKMVFQNSSHSAKDEKNKKVEQKILIQFIIIISFFLVCWISLSCVWWLALFGIRISNLDLDGVIGICCHLNSAANPAIYGLMNKNLRQAMAKHVSPWQYKIFRVIHQFLRKVAGKGKTVSSLKKIAPSDGVQVSTNVSKRNSNSPTAQSRRTTGASSVTGRSSGDSRRGSKQSSVGSMQSSVGSASNSRLDMSGVESEVDFHDSSWIDKAHSSAASMVKGSTASSLASSTSVMESVHEGGATEFSEVELSGMEADSHVESSVVEGNVNDGGLQAELAAEAEGRMAALMKDEDEKEADAVAPLEGEEGRGGRGTRGTRNTPATDRGHRRSTFGLAVDFFKGKDLNIDG